MGEPARSALFGVVLAATALAACGSPTGNPSPTTAASTASPSSSIQRPSQTATAPRCAPSVSSVVLSARTGDRLALQLVFRNMHAESCTMRGFPDVLAVEIPTKAQVRVPQVTRAASGDAVPVQTVTLTTGASGSALVEWSQSSHAAGGSCAWVGHLTVTPPGSTVSTAVGRDGLGRVCDAHVLPVAAGTSHNGYVLAPPSHTTLGLVVSHAKVAEGYRVVLAPATRQPDGQFVPIPGRATVTYLIPDALVPDGGMTLIGPIEVTVRGPQVTALTIVGG